MMKLEFLGFNEVEFLGEDNSLETLAVETVERVGGERISENEFMVPEEKIKEVAVGLEYAGSWSVNPCKPGYCESYLNDFLN